MNLQIARKAKELNQKQLADIVGVSRSTVAMWENGASQPDNEMLVRLADILETTTDYLLGREIVSDQKENPSGEPEGIDETNIEILNVWSSLSLEQKEKALSYLRYLKQEDK